MITEASFEKEGGMIRRDRESGQIYGHNGLPNLIRLCKRFAGKIILVHFGAWFYSDMQKKKKKIKALGKKYEVEVIPGYDGMKLNL